MQLNWTEPNGLLPVFDAEHDARDQLVLAVFRDASVEPAGVSARMRQVRAIDRPTAGRCGEECVSENHGECARMGPILLRLSTSRISTRFTASSRVICLAR